MKQFSLTRSKIEKKDWLRKQPAENDTTIVYDEPGVYCLDGKPVIIYGKLTERYDSFLWAVKTMGFQRESRSTSGGAIGQRNREKLGQSRIFGFRPRIPFGANYCSIASSAETHPPQHEIICGMGRVLNSIYATCAPDVAARHTELLKTISPDWVIPGTRFTSGIVNQNNPLKYHFDKRNLHDVMSCMVVLRNMVSGGFLSIPEFNARWALEDHTYFLFDGQSFLHGVTPIKKMNKHGYRYSVVYYALRAMAGCGTLTEELDQCRKEKARREKARI